MEYNDAPVMQVKCSVENCHYNDNKMCYAKKLEVNAEGNKKAETSSGTCCNTFVKNKME